MRVGGYWLVMMLTCLVNIATQDAFGSPLADTPRTILFVSALYFCGLWAEARARAKERLAAARKEKP